MEAHEVDAILKDIHRSGNNNTLAWIAENENGIWDPELDDVMAVLREYRKRRRNPPAKRDSDVYLVMRLMDYSRPEWPIHEKRERKVEHDRHVPRGHAGGSFARRNTN